MSTREPLDIHMPEGVHFVGMTAAGGPAAEPSWRGPDFPAESDVATCIACGLCLPHCPTYRLTQEESASPRGRIAAMRAVAEGRAIPDPPFMRFMDLCLACRACEPVCPSGVRFGRMLENARAQVEPLRKGIGGRLRALGLGFALPRRRALDAAAALAPLAKPLLSRRIKRLLPHARVRDALTSLPRISEPRGEGRGTVALLSGCVQDRWFREVNRASIRVLTRSGWRVVVPNSQVCCGALSAHYGRLDSAREMARKNLAAFETADFVVANAAGCSAHMKEYGRLLEGEPTALAVAGKVRDLMEFLADEGIEPPPANPGMCLVAYHDACHALHAQGIRDQPRKILSLIPGLEVVEIPRGEACCGAAGLYNVLEPAMAEQLGRAKAEAIASTGAKVVASANPGCTMQIAACLAGRGIEALHPVEILDRAYRA